MTHDTLVALPLSFFDLFILFITYRAQNEKLEKERDLNRAEKVRTERLIKQYKMEKGHVLEVRNTAIHHIACSVEFNSIKQ